MSTQVVLLRGVNVGGHNKVPLADFRALLEAAGGTDVQTYVQSGNAVLTFAGTRSTCSMPMGCRTPGLPGSRSVPR